jgi:hypothetical protein
MDPVVLVDGEAPEGWGLIPNTDGQTGTAYLGEVVHKVRGRAVTTPLRPFEVLTDGSYT